MKKWVDQIELKHTRWYCLVITDLLVICFSFNIDLPDQDNRDSNCITLLTFLSPFHFRTVRGRSGLLVCL